MPLNTPSTPPTGLKYQPQISGLRFCAVFFVIIYHYSTHLMGLRHWYDLGSFIVFFFVLSSYLITRILLSVRQKATDTGMARAKVAAVFLFRRTLRIFPAYYVYLILLMLLPVAGAEARSHAGMYFSYLSNFELYFSRTWGVYTFHFWTLAIEEQFYITWPWLILFLPVRRQPWFFAGMALAAIIFRVIMASRMTDPAQDLIPILNLTPACLDAFAIGAYLAWLHHHGRLHNVFIKRAIFILLPVWLFLIISKISTGLFIGLDRVFISLVSALIIETANSGYRGLTKKFLENGVVQYLSKISYGIYIYHLISPMLLTWFAITLQQHFGGFEWLEHIAAMHRPAFFLSFLIATGCASISWYFLEVPVNRLKNIYTYFIPKRYKTAGRSVVKEQPRKQMAN